MMDMYGRVNKQRTRRKMMKAAAAEDINAPGREHLLLKSTLTESESDGHVSNKKQIELIDEDPIEFKKTSWSIFSFSSIFTTIVLIGIIIGIYHLYKFIRDYRFANEIEAVVHIANKNPKVGETITCVVRFRTNEGRFISCFSSRFRHLKENAQICLQSEHIKNPIAVVQNFSLINSNATGKFSLRKSGSYEVGILYQRFQLSRYGSFKFEVNPGPASYRSMDFGTHNPQVLCVTSGFDMNLKLSIQDDYGNRCQLQEVDLQKFSFEAYHMGNLINVNHEFCLNESTTSSKQGTSHVEAICLKLRLDEPGIYPCVLKYDNNEVHSEHDIEKLLVCISQEEEEDLRARFTKHSIPGTLIFSCECVASQVGDSNFKSYHIGVSTSHLLISPFDLYNIGLLFYYEEKFPVNGKTKILFESSNYVNSASEQNMLVVDDGLRKAFYIQLEHVKARMFLLAYAHIQGFVLPKLGTSFQEKKYALANQLSSYFLGFWFSSEKILHIQHGNLIKSTLTEVPTDSDDWLLPFIITYECSRGLGHAESRGNAPTVTEWLNTLCEEFFIKSCDHGIFHSLPGSKLLHPTPSSLSRQPLEIYKLAGQILGKTIIEALLRKICTKMSNIRFTKSFLAFILGYPIHYEFLEADEPTYFRKIKRILEANLNGNEYTFTSLGTSESDTNTVNLIRNGSLKPVTNENKVKYLKLLAEHQLIHTVKQEITAFRDGFYSVINKDKLCDFREFDLQMLISGGYKLNITDLMDNHRVISEEGKKCFSTIQTQQLNKKKVLQWFWKVVQNMSEREQSNLIFFCTGSFSLPSCGLADLHPPFTINLSGTDNQPPTGNPLSNEIVLGDHLCFDTFERSILETIKPEYEKVSKKAEKSINFENGEYDMISEAEECDDPEGETQESTLPYERIVAQPTQITEYIDAITNHLTDFTRRFTYNT